MSVTIYYNNKPAVNLFYCFDHGIELLSERTPYIMEINEISGEVIDSAYKVHRTLGAGLLESAYEACMCYELRKRGIVVNSQVELPVIYDGVIIDLGYRIDLVVEDQVIVEFKSVEKISEVHKAQILSYLKLSKMKLGLLINFNVARVKDGIIRFANNL